MILQVCDEDPVIPDDANSSFGKDSQDDSELWKRTANFLEYDADAHELEEEMGFIDPSNPPIVGFNLKLVNLMHPFLFFKNFLLLE